MRKFTMSVPVEVFGPSEKRVEKLVRVLTLYEYSIEQCREIVAHNRDVGIIVRGVYMETTEL